MVGIALLWVESFLELDCWGRRLLLPSLSTACKKHMLGHPGAVSTGEISRAGASFFSS